MKKCPYCLNEINDETSICEFCGKNLSYSKGGLIATGIMVIMSLLSLIIYGFELESALIYTFSCFALLIRSFKVPLRWWQGILVWVGGALLGTAFSTLSNNGSLKVTILVFLEFAGLGILIIFLGYWRKGKQKKSNLDNKRSDKQETEDPYTQNLIEKSGGEGDSIVINDKCPACGIKISEKDKLCPDCGLILS